MACLLQGATPARAEIVAFQAELEIQPGVVQTWATATPTQAFVDATWDTDLDVFPTFTLTVGPLPPSVSLPQPFAILHFYGVAPDDELFALPLPMTGLGSLGDPCCGWILAGGGVTYRLDGAPVPPSPNGHTWVPAYVADELDQGRAQFTIVNIHSCAGCTLNPGATPEDGTSHYSHTFMDAVAAPATGGLMLVTLVVGMAAIGRAVLVRGVGA